MGQSGRGRPAKPALVGVGAHACRGREKRPPLRTTEPRPGTAIDANAVAGQVKGEEGRPLGTAGGAARNREEGGRFAPVSSLAFSEVKTRANNNGATTRLAGPFTGLGPAQPGIGRPFTAGMPRGYLLFLSLHSARFKRASRFGSLRSSPVTGESACRYFAASRRLEGRACEARRARASLPGC